MKKQFSVVFILLLLVSPMALHNHDRGKKEAVNTVSEIDDITFTVSRVEGKEYRETRAVVHREEDEYGGSWFDDFEDESGIGRMVAPRPRVADEHTVGLWHFDEGSGNELKDASKGENHGIIHGAGWCDGRFGKGLSFSGDGQYAEVPDNDTMDFGENEDFTIELWFRTEKVQGGRLIYKLSTSSFTGYILTCKGDGNLSFILYHNGVGHPLNVETNYGDNRWHMLAATRKGAQCTVYYDGTVAATGTLINSNISNIEDMGIGTQRGSSHYFEGMMDEIRISKVARNEEEMAKQYSGGLLLRDGKVRFAPRSFDPGSGCVGYLSFDEGTGNTAHDGSGNGNDGALKPSVKGSRVNWTTDGIFGNALKFDGVDDYVECVNNSLFNFTAQMTLETWIKPTGFSAQKAIISKDDNGGIRPWFLALNNNKLQFRIETSGGTINLQSVNSPFLNQWNYVVGTYDGVDARLYLNGNLEKTIHLVGKIKSDNDSVRIANFDMAVSDHVFPGFIDETCIYNSSLNQYEIGQHYNDTSHSTSCPTNATITSTPISLPASMNSSTLSITKTEPPNTHINVSILNAVTNRTIPGYENKTLRNIDISNITANSIRLKAHFSGNGSATPSLDSWGVEWTTDNAWRDSFTGDAKVASQQKADEHTAAIWHFDEGRGNIVRDISGNGNNGTVEGADRCEGKFGGGLKFNGRTGRVSVPDSDSLDILDELTIELWVKPNDLYDAPIPGNWEWLLIKGSDDDWYGTYSLAMDMAGKITFRLEDSMGNMHSLGFNVLDENGYVQLAYVYDGQNMLIYKNGNLMASKYTGRFEIMGSSRDMYLWWQGGGNRHIGGILDEVRISNISRTPEEIQQSYQGGVVIRGGEARLGENGMETGRGCVGYWPCDETSGDTLDDLSGNGNEGTINGTNRTDGVFGKAYAFNGIDDEIDCGNDASLLNANVTVECWINPSDLSGSYQTVISKSTRELDGYAIMCHDGGVLMEFSGPWVRSIAKTGCFRTGNWYHIAMTYGSNEFIGYLDGKMFGKINYNMAVPASQPFKIGNGYDTKGINGITGFNGLIDSVSVHNRVLSPSDIYNRSGLHPPEAHLISEIITLPDNQTWETLHVNSSVPENTYLNVSVHDPLTDDVILNETTRSSNGIISLDSINALDNSSIYLRANFRSNRTGTPVIYNWAVKWTPMVYPEQIKTINDTWITEDTPTAGILDLSEFFHDVYTHIEPSQYDVTYISDHGNITPGITNSSLDVTGLARNFTGNIGIIVSCTNVYNLGLESNLFNITVMQEDDAPSWKSAFPEITLNEDSTITTNWSLDEFVDDAEGDLLDFIATPEDRWIDCLVEDSKKLTVTATGDHYGETFIHVLGYETKNNTLATENVTISVMVKAVNDPPDAELAYPMNGSVLGDVNVSFEWKGFDVDNDAAGLTYDLYLGKGRTPEVYRSYIPDTEIMIRGLEDGFTYYWFVLPHDGELPGDCVNGTWSFSIDTSIRIPTLNLISPLNNMTINTTDVNLSWEVTQPGSGELSFHVYGGSSEDALGEIAISENTWYFIEELNDNSTYYWKVIPISDSIEGKCLSGVWRFSINTSYEGGKNLTVIPDVDRLEIVLGKGIGFNLTLINNDMVPFNVTLNVSGSFADLVNMTRSISVIPGTPQRIGVNVTGTSNLTTGDYNLTLEFGYLGRTDMIIIPVKIVPDKPVIGDDDGDGGGGDTEKRSFFDNICVILGMVFFATVLGVVLFLVIRKRRRAETTADEESEDVIDAEIVPEEQSGFAESVKHSTPRRTETTDTPPLNTPQTGVAAEVTETPHRSPASPSPAREIAPPPSPPLVPQGASVVQSSPPTTPDAPGISSPPPTPQGVSAVQSTLSTPQGASAVQSTLSTPQGASAIPSTSSAPQSASAVPSTSSAPQSASANPSPLPVSAQDADRSASQESLSKGPQIVGIDRGFTLTDIFLVYVDGRLIKSVSFETQLREGMDEDIMSGMLTAITDFIQDSFKEDTGALKTLQYGKMTIFLERGVGMYVAVVFHGNPPTELREKMRWLLIRLWKKYKYKLKVWDGSYDGLDGLTPILRSMMEQKEKAEEKETAPEPAKPHKAAAGAGPIVSVATEAVMCDICMGVVKPGLEIMSCSCGNKFHKSCGERVGECPKCTASLIVSEPKEEQAAGIPGVPTSGMPSGTAAEQVPDPGSPAAPDIDSIFDIPLGTPDPEEEALSGPDPVLPSGEHEEEGGTKALPEFSGQEAGEIDEFRIEI